MLNTVVCIDIFLPIFCAVSCGDNFTSFIICLILVQFHADVSIGKLCADDSKAFK